MTCPAGVKTSVCPSFADANTCTPTIPSAPGRLSTTTGCRQRSDSRGARRRATRSLPVPGPNGTMTVTGRVGHWDIRAVVGLWLRDPALLAAEQAARPDVFVDELQDTDPAQVELLQLLAGGGRDLVAVGDPDQSIYGFRGADVAGIRRVPRPVPHRRRRPRAGRRADHLPRGPAPACSPRPAGSPRGLGGPRRAPATCCPRPGCRPASSRSPCCAPRRRRPPTSPPGCGEAHLVDGVPWSQMAVLVRSTVRSMPVLRRAMVAAGVPVAVAGDEVPLVQEPAVRPLLLLLRACVDPARASTRTPPSSCSPRRSAAPT